jgi:serine phosphatase RsbU (regulator of sigma subunit)/anti-sigma regulatory factor (Ser/Thr protein kinase)
LSSELPIAQNETVSQPRSRILDPFERLRRLQLVTDATLAHLSVDGLLDELLLRVRDILDADTAAVLLLDPSTDELVARAAKGIEEEVEQGVRIPVGKGFAGRIAAERRPVTLDRVDHSTVLNPILFQKGIRSLLGVPLLANGEVVGVMHVGTTTPRVFTQHEIDLMQLVADRVALALQVRLSDRGRVVLDAFQRTFLPDVLPYVPGLRIATRYLPAASTVGVGGDWYDTFALPSGELIFVIGDVAGHGLAAASLMGKMRNALRAHALLGGSATDIVARADEFHRHFGQGELVTLLVGVLTRDLETFRFVSAGHAPPLVVDREGAAFAVQEHPNPPLGMTQAPSFTDEVVPLRLGTSILLYTDGLMERRDESLDVGLERLRRTAEGLVNGREPSDSITDLVQKILGEERPIDDVALLLIQRDAEPRKQLEFAVDARAHSLAVIRRTVSRWLQDLQVSRAVESEVVTAVSEASANAVEHAYGPAGGMILISATVETDLVDVRVRDSGTWRTSSRGGGLGKGLQVMRSLMDEVHIESSEHGSLVTLRRKTA